MNDSYSVIYSSKAMDDLVDNFVIFYTVDEIAMTVTVIRIVYGGRDIAGLADSEK